MQTKTRAELVTEALSNLGVTESGQTPSDEDMSVVDGHVDGLLARLSAKEIVTVDDDSEIPLAWFSDLAVLLADDAAPEFGSQSSPGRVALSENNLRVITRVVPTRRVLAVDYF